MFSIKNFLLLTALQLGSFSGVRYFFPLLAPVLYLSAALYRGNVRFPRSLFFLIMIYLPVMLIGLIRSTDVVDLIFSLIKVTLPIVLFSISYSAFYAQQHRAAGQYLERLVLSVIIVGGAECLIRYYWVFAKGRNIFENFYIAKINSPFFIDANATALFLVNGLFLTALIRKQSFKHTMFVFILFGLIVLTLSRAAIFGAALFVVIVKLRDLPFRLRIITLSTCACLALIFIPFAYALVSFDGSGATKIQVYDVFFSKILSGELSLGRVFLGDGLSKGSLTYGYQEGKFSHALIPMLVGQIGIIGLCFWALFVVCSLAKVNLYLILALFACIFVPGLSYAHPFYEFFYVSLGFASASRSWGY